jgi:phage replication O-like protein O
MTPPIQPEAGYTRIAHPIIEGLAQASFPNALFRVVLVVVRETYGWQRTSAPISYTELGRATGLPRKTVARSVAELLGEGVIQCVRPATATTAAVYKLQKNPARWGRFRVSVEVGGVDAQGDTLAGDTLAGDTLAGDTLAGDRGVDAQGDRGVDAQGDTQGGLSGANKEVGSALKIVKDRKDSARARKRALPDDWTPNEGHRRIAAELGIDLKRENEKMCDWALSKGEKRADWDATFRNWLRSDIPKATLPTKRNPEMVVVDD